MQKRHASQPDRIPVRDFPWRSRRRHGISMIEVMVVLTVMGVLIAASAPSFSRTIEQANADVAAANLRAVWIAQRMYWLEYRQYASTIEELSNLDLLDVSITTGSLRYQYEMESADQEGFESTATRVNSERWSGRLVIDESGVVTGTISIPGSPDIQPGFL